MNGDWKERSRRFGIVRENKIPFFGICLGMQCAVVEFARNVLGSGGKLNRAESKDQKPGDRYDGGTEEDHKQGRDDASWRVLLQTEKRQQDIRLLMARV